MSKKIKRLNLKHLRQSAWKGTKKSIPATTLCLLLFFMNMALFGYKNAVIAVPLTIIFNRLKDFSPDRWHPYSVMLINLVLAVTAHLADMNVWLCVTLDFAATYLMVFLLTDSDTSKAYYSYGFGLVLYQSFSTTVPELRLRLMAIVVSSAITTLGLVVMYFLKRRQTGFKLDPHIFNPFVRLGGKTRDFLKGTARAFKNLAAMLRFRLFTDPSQPLESGTFDFRLTRFAIRISLLVTFSFFLERVFNIPKGYWLPLNVFIMTLNFYEDSMVKIKQRVGGNIAGVFISAILLHYITGFTGHMIILSIGTFLGYAVDNYLFRATYMTCYAIALSTLFMKQSEVFELRLAYVLLAAVIAVIGSRFIFANKKTDFQN